MIRVSKQFTPDPRHFTHSKVYLILAQPSYNIILDLGCGKGTYLFVLSERCRYLIEADISLFELQNAKQSVLETKIRNRVDFIAIDARFLPFRNGCIDLVFASEILEHLSNEDLGYTLEEIERVACGLLATVPNPHAPHFRKDPSHILKYTVSGLTRWLLHRNSRFKYQVAGLDFPLLKDKILRCKLSRKLVWNFLRFVPWLSTTLVISMKREYSQNLQTKSTTIK